MANYYYSGQGSLYVAERNADGTAKGFVELGNVPSLELSIDVTKFEHKESQSGSRAVDLTIVQEKNGTFSMQLESITKENLALGFWGQSAVNAAGSLSDLVVKAAVDASGSVDYRVPLVNTATGQVYPSVTFAGGDTIGDDATPTTTYEFGTSDTDLVNSKNGYVDEANGVLVIYSAAKQTARGAAASITDGQDLYVDIASYGATTQVDAFTVSSQERWLRFEGLNTIDNKAVIVDLFKASLDPLSGYALINEELSSLEVNGSILYDSLQPGASKFFRQVNVT